MASRFITMITNRTHPAAGPLRHAVDAHRHTRWAGKPFKSNELALCNASVKHGAGDFDPDHKRNCKACATEVAKRKASGGR